MSEEFKNKLIKFICGKLDVKEVNNTINYQKIKSINNNLKTYLNTNFSEGYFIKGSVEIGEHIIIYGYYIVGDSFKGFIFLFDNEFNLIKDFRKYASGTEFGEFIILDKDEKDQLYGIDSKNGTKRFIMLNNFLIKINNEYKVVLRQSYNLPSQVKNANNFTLLKKNPNASEYLIFATKQNEQYISDILITKLTINVGSTNEWIDYTSTNFPFFYANDAVINWENNNLQFICNGFKNINGIAYYTEIKFSNGKLTQNYVSEGISNLRGADCKILSFDEAYYGVSKFENGKEIFLIYHKKNDNINLIYSDVTDGANDFLGYSGKIELKRKDYKVFFIIHKTINQTNSDSTLLVKIGSILEDDRIFIKEICEASMNNDLIGLNLFVINKDNNKHNFYVQVSDICYITEYFKTDLNVLDELDCLVPKFLNIYDSENKLLLSKDIYNLNISENIVIANININNISLNEIDLHNKVMYSNTNLKMFENAKATIKNIYENLFINFIYSYVFCNQNNNIKSAVFQNGNELIKAIMNKKYSEFYINKIKIIYSDGTIKVSEVSEIEIENNKAKIQILFKAEKDVKEIQICNKNLDLVFISIQEKLNSNKFYKLVQEIEVL